MPNEMISVGWKKVNKLLTFCIIQEMIEKIKIIALIKPINSGDFILKMKVVTWPEFLKISKRIDDVSITNILINKTENDRYKIPLVGLFFYYPFLNINKISLNNYPL